MNEFFYILVVVVVLTLLWKSLKEYMAAQKDPQQSQHKDKQHEPHASKEIQDVSNKKHVSDMEAGEDYLLLATEKGAEAKLAMREKNNAEAWELLQQQKSLFSKFATNEGKSGAESTALDAGVSKELANILRLDKKHKEALVHVIYWIANSKSVTKDQEGKLQAYFNRAKLSGTVVGDVMEYCLIDGVKEFSSIQKDVDSWE